MSIHLHLLDGFCSGILDMCEPAETGVGMLEFK